MAHKPIDPDAKFGRVDQGVDYSQAGPYRAIANGTVVRLGKVAGGTNIGLYYKFDKPITVNGRTYNGAYVWHTTPLVKPGHRVKAGQPIMSGGSAEVGWATADGRPAGDLVGGLGAGTKATQAGQDMLDFASGKAGKTSNRDYSMGSLTSGAAANQAASAAAQPVLAPPQAVPPQAVPPPTALGLPAGGGPELPGSVNYSLDAHDASVGLWSQVATSDFVSPDTQAMLRNAQLSSTGG